MWGIWRAHNSILYEHNVLAHAQGALNAFISLVSSMVDPVVNICSNFELNERDHHADKLKRPQKGWYKLNSVVNVKKQQGLVDYRGVIRNHEGLVMVTAVDQGIFYDDVDMVEAEALRFGIQLARETGLSPLLIFNAYWFQNKISEFVMSQEIVIKQ